jgi:hypothetical protein
MKRGLTGHYVPIPSAAGESARAFVPNVLPPDPPLVTAALGHLEKLGIVREATGRKYGRLYTYINYLKILNEGTEPLRT